jgi:hypothetical protein
MGFSALAGAVEAVGALEGYHCFVLFTEMTFCYKKSQRFETAQGSP